MSTLTISIDEMQAAAADACRLMKALANPDRLLLLCQLAQGEMSVGGRSLHLVDRNGQGAHGATFY